MGRLAFRSHIAGATLLVLTLLVLVGLSQAAFGADECRSSNADVTTFRTLIDKANTIVLATAATAEPPLFAKSGVLNFIFDVEETLKGYQKKPLRIKARLNDDDPDFPRRDLDAHRRMSFWDRMETRLVHVSSCAQELNFRLGETYLLIDPGRGPGLMSVRFEQIEDVEGDLWLAAVRRMMANPGEAPMTMTIDQYIRAQQSVAFAVMPYCNEKLRSGASRVAEISEPLWGTPVERDGLHPEIFADALLGCDGFTALLGIFYQPDQSRPKDAALGSTVYPGQRYTGLEGETIRIDQLRTEVRIIGPETVTLSELIAALREP